MFFLIVVSRFYKKCGRCKEVRIYKVGFRELKTGDSS